VATYEKRGQPPFFAKKGDSLRYGPFSTKVDDFPKQRQAVPFLLQKTRLSPFFVCWLLLCACALQGCLVLSLHPAYSDDSLAWDPALVGNWRDADDITSLQITAAEWRSYKIHYEHPSENGDLTGYLTIVGDERYLDVTPVRGQDWGSFLLPLHAVVRVKLDADTLTVTPLSYDVLSSRLRTGRSASPGLAAVLDQKQNVLITSPTSRLRAWLRTGQGVWGVGASFAREERESLIPDRQSRIPNH
jgi:hypothetical protein